MAASPVPLRAGSLDGVPAVVVSAGRVRGHMAAWHPIPGRVRLPDSLCTMPVLWIVPVTKHLTPVMLPLAVFGGIARRLPRLASRCVVTAWNPRCLGPRIRLVERARWHWPRSAGLHAVHHARLTGCRWRRRDYLDDIRELVRRTGSDVVDRVHGGTSFSLRLAPGEQQGWQGYLLQLSAGTNPGELTCRHIRYPRDWLWAAMFSTRAPSLAPKSPAVFLCLGVPGRSIRRPSSVSVAHQSGWRRSNLNRVPKSIWPIGKSCRSAQSSWPMTGSRATRTPRTTMPPSRKSCRTPCPRPSPILPSRAACCGPCLLGTSRLECPATSTSLDFLLG